MTNHAQEAVGAEARQGEKRGWRMVILGLSITSSWGNGHATTYRGLVKELCRRGHDVLFLERDLEWYALNRDMARPPFGRTELYGTLGELKNRHEREVREADVVMVGSYVPEGSEVGRWVTTAAEGLTIFYDIDTPVTLAGLARGDSAYLTASLIPRYGLYLSFTGGPTLEVLEREHGARRARALYCSVDPSLYYHEAAEAAWDLGYMGTYSADRQPALERLLAEPARRFEAGRFVVAGPQYPEVIRWPRNVARIEHLSPEAHRGFYNGQRFTLNLTRADMAAAGYSPSVRLFEAAACGTPIITDEWEGLGDFFEAGEEILVSRSSEETLRILRDMAEAERRELGMRGRWRVLSSHTSRHRARELEGHIREAMGEEKGLKQTSGEI